MKRISILPILLLFIIFSAVSAKTNKEFEYSVQIDGTVRIDSYNGTATSITIPAQIDGLPVASIGEGAFTGNGTLTDIIFDSESITLEARSFTNCSNLKNVSFTNNVKNIVIGSADWTPFVLATSLNTLTIPDTVESLIVNKAGFVFSSLSTLTIGSREVVIDSYAFDTPFQLSEIAFTQNVQNITLGNGTDPLFYTAEMLTEFIIPDTVASLTINQNAMAEIDSLQNVSIGSADTTIEKNAFSGCNDLESVIFTNPYAVNIISEMAFSDCPKLENIVFLTAEEANYPETDADAEENSGTVVSQINEQEAVQLTADALVASILSGIESTAGHDIFAVETSTPTMFPTDTQTPTAIPTNTPTQVPTSTPTATATITITPIKASASTGVSLQAIDELITENKAFIEENLINPSEQFVIEKLSGLDVITEIAAATEDHDPNGGLHKPGKYKSAVYFATVYLDPSTVDGDSIIDKGTKAGGQIEVYETVEDAQNRDDYLSSFKGYIDPGSHRVFGSMVIRTSKDLTATQQKELERAIISNFLSTSSAATDNSFEVVKTPMPSSFYREMYGDDQKTITVKVDAKGSGNIRVYDQPSLSGKVVARTSGPLEIDLTVDPVYADNTNWVMGKVNRKTSGWVPVENLIFPEPEVQDSLITDAKNDTYQKLYDQASAMLQAGNYDTAKLIFETISDYSDSAEMIKECDYQHALGLESGGSYVDAMVVFTLLGNYKDSSDHVLQNALNLQQPQNIGNTPTDTPTPKPTTVPVKSGSSGNDVLEIKESGFSLSSDGYLFYSFIMYNNSNDIAVRRPSFRVVARDKNGILLGMEEGTLNAFLYPGQEICYGDQGFKVSEEPASVEVQIVKPSSYDYRGVSSIDHPEYIPLEFHNIVNTSSREYLGDVFNPNDYDFSEIEICVLFRDNDNNLKAGDCSTADSLSADSSIPFKIFAWCPVETNYEICGFGRLY